jgi:hypothetical protein
VSRSAPARRPPEPPRAEQPAPSVQSLITRESAPPARWLTPARLGFALAALLIILGLQLPLGRWLSPERGFGYALGIFGGSAMLLLLVYPARKRWSWLRFLGSVKHWFQIHMALGVIGPLCILYHSNFSLGATNSNAPLFAMITVAASGVVGRYLYSRIHTGLYGHRTTRAELQAVAEELRVKVAGSTLIPELLGRLDAAELGLVERSGSLLLPFTVSARMWWERWRLTRYVTRELRRAASHSRGVAERRAQVERALRGHITRRLQATRQVVEFEAYERLFSLWHVLHLPLFFLLLIAGVAHVVAVHVY